MSEPLRSGRITHQRLREDGTWEETPGWMSVSPDGVHIVLSELTEEEDRMAVQYSDAFVHEDYHLDMHEYQPDGDKCTVCGQEERTVKHRHTFLRADIKVQEGLTPPCVCLQPQWADIHRGR